MGQESDRGRQLIVSASPHLRRPGSVEGIMWAVVIALLPALGGAVWYFGLRALAITGLAVGSALVSEALAQRALGRPITVHDGSAVITGLLVALNLPPAVPWWIPVAGSAFAIVICKQIFGGLGYNFINPALGARAFLMASWPSLMTSGWIAPRGGTLAGIDAATQATPLALLKATASPKVITALNAWPSLKQHLLGCVGGSLGETSVLLLAVGGIFLLALRLIDYRIVVGYLGTAALLTAVLPTPGSPFFHLLSGGLMLGALFMATDYVTSPVSRSGRWIFGAGCGLLTVVIRIWGGYPEGVCYAILLMNVASPLIDRLTRPRVFGEVKR